MNNIGKLVDHTAEEFIESSAFIITGAFLSAVIQIVLPQAILYSVGNSPVFSVVAMMCFTWLISLCSNADAFVAKSFYGFFTTGSVVAFMTFGQMIDLKNTIALFGYFKKKFVLTVILVISLLCFLCGILINFAGRIL